MRGYTEVLDIISLMQMKKLDVATLFNLVLMHYAIQIYTVGKWFSGLYAHVTISD